MHYDRCHIVVPCTNGDVRVRGTSSERIGRVEVCINGTWGTICTEKWDNIDASVVCRQLGFSPYGVLYLYSCKCMLIDLYLVWDQIWLSLVLL